MYSLIIKFFREKEHLKQFRNGMLYSQTFEHFRKQEADGGTRNDPLEGLVQQIKVPSGTLQLKPSKFKDELWKEMPFLNGIFSKFHNGNIFCFSRFELKSSNEIQELLVDERFDQFGDYYAIISNQIKFDERLKQAIEKSKLNVLGRMVEYTNFSNFSGKCSVFKKSLGYSWQSEYRLHFDTDSKQTLEFKMSQIRDISIVGRLSEGRKFHYKAPLDINFNKSSNMNCQ